MNETNMPLDLEGLKLEKLLAEAKNHADGFRKWEN